MSKKWSKYDKFPRSVREAWGPYHHSSMIQDFRDDYQRSESLSKLDWVIVILCCLLVAVGVVFGGLAR